MCTVAYVVYFDRISQDTTMDTHSGSIKGFGSQDAKQGERKQRDDICSCEFSRIFLDILEHSISAS